MILEQVIEEYFPVEFNPGGSTQLGNTLRWRIPRTFPIEFIIVTLYLNITASAFTSTAVGSCTTQDQIDSFLNLCQRMRLVVNEGIRAARTAVDCSGIRLLEYLSRTSSNLPPELWKAVQLANQRGAAAWPIGQIQIPYLIPMVDDFISEPLRSGCYLPAHMHTQDPELQITFNTLANMGLTAGTLTNLDVGVTLVRRRHSPASEAWLQSRKAKDNTPLGTNQWGYIDWDLVEQTFNPPLGVAQEFRAKLSIPGTYLGLLMTQYLGGAALTRAPLRNSLGDTHANSMGNVERWRIETGLVPRRYWRDETMMILNGFILSQNNIPSNAAAAAIPVKWNISPDIVGAPDESNWGNANTLWRSPSCYYLDFLSDGKSFNQGNELGSAFDTNAINQKNLLAEVIIEKAASAATNASILACMGRRFIGDISGWQKF